MSNEKSKELAEQLRLPNGEKGIEIGEMMHQTNFSMTKHAIDRMDLSADNSILEIGHGNAKHLEYLFEKQPNTHYFGLEISELMHQQAIENAKKINISALTHFQLYDGYEMPFKDNFFDSIFTVNTIYFWENPDVFVQQIFRMLKPKGRLIITFIQEETFEKLPFTQYGFTAYNNNNIKTLFDKSNFVFINSYQQTEDIISKSGEPIERKFSTFIWEK